MRRTTARRRRLLAALALLFALSGARASMGVGATPSLHPDPDVLERLRPAETANGEAVLVGSDVTVGSAEASRVSLPLAAFAPSRGRPATLRRIAVAGPDGVVRSVTRPNRRLIPISDLARSVPEVLDRLASRVPEHAQELLSRGFASTGIEVPVGDLELEDGTTATFTVTATFDAAGAEKTAVLPLAVTVATLPTALYWGAGDGHVHSSEWSDGWNTLSAQVSAAKSYGHKWVLMTDHWKGIWAVAGRGNANWALYREDCSTKEAQHGIPVLPGTEIMAAANQGHALAYALGGSKAPPRDEYLTPAELVKAINDHTPGSSYAVIAHPYSVAADAWRDWSASGFRAIELMSQERQASASTQTRWFQLLRAGLSSRVAGGPFVVGVANSDSHAPWQRPGEAGVTWIRSTTSPLTREAVWNAIRTGAASASGREDLGYFSVNGVQQGGVVAASATTALKFTITQKPVTGRKCTEISIRNSNNAVVWSVSNPTASTCTKTLPAPASDTFYVVKMVFAKTNDTDYSHVWCNPVFVDRR